MSATCAGYVVEVEPGRWINRGGIRVDKLDYATVYGSEHGARIALGIQRRATGAKWPNARIRTVGLVMKGMP